MHACGHDVHITSLVGTAQIMAARRDEWQGTLMLIGQPAEERVMGAAAMRADNLWERFGQPDYAMAFQVTSAMPTGILGASVDSPYSGADTVDIYITGVGAHGASPHRGVDPIVLGSQIVMGLQTVVSRTLPPRRPSTTHRKLNSDSLSWVRATLDARSCRSSSMHEAVDHDVRQWRLYRTPSSLRRGKRHQYLQNKQHRAT